VGCGGAVLLELVMPRIPSCTTGVVDHACTFDHLCEAIQRTSMAGSGALAVGLRRGCTRALLARIPPMEEVCKLSIFSIAFPALIRDEILGDS